MRHQLARASANTGSVSNSDLLITLTKIAKHRLTAKQKVLLREIIDNDLNATQLVRYLSGKLRCSKSALWNNMRELRDINLLSWKDKCQLTEVGIIISTELERGGEQKWKEST